LTLALFVAAGVYFVRMNPGRARAWALNRQATLRKQGQTPGPRTEKLLAAMLPATVAPKPTPGPTLNKFGVPVSKAPTSPKKLSRKQAKARAVSDAT
jgi:hypothetical protein